jgi:hypothetical protein
LIGVKGPLHRSLNNGDINKFIFTFLFHLFNTARALGPSHNGFATTTASTP